MKKAKIAVVGAGPAGMMAAGKLAFAGLDVTLFERNALLGKKLGITGKGRCNITNDCTPDTFIKNVAGNGKFMFSAINRFSPRDAMEFFESLGVPLKVERGNRVFPVSDKATDVVLAMKKYAVSSGAQLVNERVLGIDNSGKISVKTVNSVYRGFDATVICTGGLSYPLTGSTGDGYEFARSLGHNIIPPEPSLVGLESEDKLCRDAQGLSLKNVAIKVDDIQKSKTVYEDFGEMLFTHFGVSGPVILSASAHMRPMKEGKYTVSIDLKPALTHEKLDARVLSDFEKYKNRDLDNALADLLPQKLIHPFIKTCRLEYDKKINSITKEERARVVETLKCLKITVHGTRPIDEAIVTSGGVDTREIDPKTMASRLCENVYFAGEIIDVDAYTGGFNIQIALSTAVCAADAVIAKYT